MSVAHATLLREQNARIEGPQTDSVSKIGSTSYSQVTYTFADQRCLPDLQVNNRANLHQEWTIARVAICGLAVVSLIGYLVTPASRSPSSPKHERLIIMNSPVSP